MPERRSKKKLLIAAQPMAWRELQPILQRSFDLLPVQTVSQAIRMLAREPGIDAIVATIGFDDFRIFQLLRAIKQNPGTKNLAFISCRALRSMLGGKWLDRLPVLFKWYGVDAYIDLASLQEKFGPQIAATRLRAVVVRCISSKRAALKRGPKHT